MLSRIVWSSLGRTAQWVLLLVVLGSGGCTTTGPVATKAKDDAAKAQVVPPDQAALYLVRPHGFYGSAVIYELIVDGGLRTKLGPGNYAFRLVKPGEHAIEVGCRCSRPAQMTLSTAPGKAYFVTMEGDFFRMPGDPTVKLTVLQPEEGRAALEDLRLVDWSPAPRSVPAAINPQVATAALVEANVCLLRIGDCSAPALVVFSLDSEMSFHQLRKLAKLTYSTKGTVPATEELRVLAKPFADETYRGDAFIKVPASLGYGGNTYVAPIWVERSRIPGKLSSQMALKLNVYIVGGAPYTTRFLSVDPTISDR
jgi:hypothetical protein